MRERFDRRCAARRILCVGLPSGCPAAGLSGRRRLKANACLASGPRRVSEIARRVGSERGGCGHGTCACRGRTSMRCSPPLCGRPWAWAWHPSSRDGMGRWSMDAGCACGGSQAIREILCDGRGGISHLGSDLQAASGGLRAVSAARRASPRDVACGMRPVPDPSCRAQQCVGLADCSQSTELSTQHSQRRSLAFALSTLSRW